VVATVNRGRFAATPPEGIDSKMTPFRYELLISKHIFSVAAIDLCGANDDMRSHENGRRTEVRRPLVWPKSS
jgi:hypothetical protein